MKVSVIVPTYNERDNMAPLVERINTVMSERDYEVIVVDDNSPDRTVDAVQALADRYPVKVIKRMNERGLGTAVLEGFRQASGDIMGVIDADLQHPPEVIRDLVVAMDQGADIAIATRYMEGGGVKEWPLLRRIKSMGAGLLAKPLTRVRDPMSGCFMLTREIACSSQFRPIGYKILLEILVKARYRKVTEVPYTFGTRYAGESKLDVKEQFRYIGLLVKLYLYKLRPRRL